MTYWYPETQNLFLADGAQQLSINSLPQPLLLKQPLAMDS